MMSWSLGGTETEASLSDWGAANAVTVDFLPDPHVGSTATELTAPQLPGLCRGPDRDQVTFTGSTGSSRKAKRHSVIASCIAALADWIAKSKQGTFKATCRQQACAVMYCIKTAGRLIVTEAVRRSQILTAKTSKVT